MISSNEKCMFCYAFYYAAGARISCVTQDGFLEGRIKSINEVVTIETAEDEMASIFPENIQALSIPSSNRFYRDFDDSFDDSSVPTSPIEFPGYGDDFAYEVSSSEITSISSQNRSNEQNSWLVKKAPDGSAFHYVLGYAGLEGSDDLDMSNKHLLVIKIRVSLEVKA